MIWVLPILSAIFWRMGGAARHDKLWRRLGSSACCFLPMILCHNPLTYGHLIALGMIIWGSWSYFGWINPKDDSEYWYNFLAAAVITEFSFLVLFPSWKAAGIAILFACISAFGKVLIDRDRDGYILWWREDVLSELFYGFFICLGISVNCFLS